MRIIVTDDVRIEDVEDLTSLDVASALPVPQIDSRLRGAGLGTATDDHAWILADALRAAASSGTSSPDWNAAYDRMLDYARSKGWSGDDGATIRAHITLLD